MTDRFDDGFKPTPAPPSGPHGSPRSTRHRHPVLLRASAIGVAGILSALMLTAVVPPIVADQSDRAVVNAPIMLLTSPISGQVESLSAAPGGEVRTSDRLAQITNSRLDRTTLISLEEKAGDARQKLDATRAKHQSDLAYVTSLDQEIGGQAEQLKVQLRSQIEELRARVAQSSAMSSEKKAIVDRQNRMVARDAASAEMLKPTEQQYTAALRDTDAQNAKLNQKLTQLKALDAGIYVGEDLAALNMLGQKRRDIDLDARRMEIEEKQQSAMLQDLEGLINSERARLARLAAADVLSPGPGKVLAVGAETGRHVSAGDTIASVVDCDKRFVVAIFSYRQGETMKPGTRVRIEGGGFHAGVVSAVLPKTSDKVDERFAVPFPQTERRELYVMITPDAAAERPAVEPTSAATPACTVGQWVTVTRDNGIVPSMSVTWRRLGHLVASLTDLDPPEPNVAARPAGIAKLDEALRSQPASARQPEVDAHWLPAARAVSAQ